MGVRLSEDEIEAYVEAATVSDLSFEEYFERSARNLEKHRELLRAWTKRGLH